MLCEGVLFLVGVVIFITGKVRITSGNLVEGSRAHLIALFLILPIPLAFLFRETVARNNPVFFGSAGRILDGVTVIQFVIWMVCLLIALIIGFTNPVSPKSEGLSYPAPPIMTPEEAALYMRIPVDEVYRLIENRQIQAVMIGQQYRISKEMIDAMFQR